MLAKIESRAIYGITAYRVDVEVDISSGIPSFSIVGLPDTACRESSKRVMAALKNSGYKLPSLHITVNLAPAYIKKEGAMYDLAIALGILSALEKIDSERLRDKVVCGELSFDGSLRIVKGALSIADGLKEEKQKELIIPVKNFYEVSVIKEVKAVACHNLNEAVAYLVEGLSPENLKKPKTSKSRPAPADENIDYSDIKGNSNAKRAMEVAVAGGHNIIIIGPPGVGKTMLARRLPTIMGVLDEEASIETSKIYSVYGLFNKDEDLIRTPPFRVLHHSISYAGMVGGGTTVRPGEISLAHNGVLFLDELPEFRRDVLEALRQPIEEGIIRVRRVNMAVTYPSQFMLVAAMNPCPCGFLTHPEKVCTCTPPQVQRYLSKISGPLLDRIDLHIEVQPIKYEQMKQKHNGEPSSAIKARIENALKVQDQRYKKCSFKQNSKLPRRLIDEVCEVADEGGELLKKAMSELFMSARAYDKILKIARTIADLDDKPTIGIDEISEAIGYRCLDRNFWV